jgi:hypothetical protein
MLDWLVRFLGILLVNVLADLLAAFIIALIALELFFRIPGFSVGVKLKYPVRVASGTG